jgi:hypothetical protein
VDAYDELNAWSYTPAGGSLHQYVVDAHAAQTADESTKPITLVFALVGLCLHLERGYDGLAIRNLHQRMANNKSDWPTLKLPEARGEVTPADVMAVPEAERAGAVSAWSESVWAAYADAHEEIRRIVASYLG